MMFLERSRVAREQEIKDKEKEQRARLRQTRRAVVIVAIVALIAIGFGITAYIAGKRAETARINAEQQTVVARDAKQNAEAKSKEALTARQVAVTEKERAQQNMDTAIAERKKAEAQELRAEEEKGRAQIAQSEARRSAEEAKSSAYQALLNAESAKRSQEDAEASKLQAEKEKREAMRLERIAESKNVAREAVVYRNEEKYTLLNDYAIRAYDSNVTYHGNFQENDIYNALQLSWTHKISRRNQAHLHMAPVRTIVALPGSDAIISADENGQILLSSYDNGVLSKQSWAAVYRNSEIRALAVDPRGHYLLAVCTGRAELFSIGADKKMKRLDTIKISGIGRHAAFLSPEVFIVQSTTGLTRYNVGMPSRANDSLRLPDCNALAVSGDTICMSYGTQIVIYDGWTSNRAGHTIAHFSAAARVTSLSIDKTCNYIAAGMANGGLWTRHLRSGRESQFTLHLSAINDLQFCDIGYGHLQLATASNDRTIKLIEVNGSDHKLNIYDVITLTDHNSWVYALAYSARGNFLFSGSEDKKIIAHPTTMALLKQLLTNK